MVRFVTVGVTECNIHPANRFLLVLNLSVVTTRDPLKIDISLPHYLLCYFITYIPAVSLFIL